MMMEERRSDEVRQIVRERYGRVAEREAGGCGGATEGSGCCGPSAAKEEKRARQLGYSEEELRNVPDGANLGLGCGNPGAIAALRPGETVVDLGSGGGFDCFLAARQVGETGRVIGVDMTSEMVARARENARKGGYANVSFRLGEIEHLPVPDASADAILSNCVINLSPDKRQVYRDAFRVLKPGGRLAISDVAVSAPLPQELRDDPTLLSGCVAGAVTPEETEAMVADAGFEQVSVRPKDASREFIREWVPGRRLEEYLVSVTVEAVKPA
jgi:SAM-dependent methyltransferase